jgi:hypothetical protein
MKTLNFKFSHLLLAGGIFFLSSCDKDDDSTTTPPVNEQKKTVKEVLESEDRYSMMNEAVEESDQTQFFAQSNTNITLFAANNDAFKQLFAQMNVSNMTELKAKMGDEAFADLVLYQAINGRFTTSSVSEGYHETNAENDNKARLTLFVKKEGDGSLTINGNDDNGARTTGSVTINATNGALIEVNAVLQAQTNLENIEDGEEENESNLFVDVLTSADASTRLMLDDESENNTILVANDAQVEAMLGLYLQSILDVEDLDNLLDASSKNTLFGRFNVTTALDLLAQISLADLLSLNGIVFANIMAELDADDKSELMSSLIFAGDIDLEKEAAQNGSITSEAGASFDVSFDAQNNIVLTDNDDNKITIASKAAQSVNGSVYTIAKVEEKQ